MPYLFVSRSCFLSTVKMCKLLFIAIGYSTISVVAKALKSDNPPTTSVRQSASVLQSILHHTDSASSGVSLQECCAAYLTKSNATGMA